MKYKRKEEREKLTIVTTGKYTWRREIFAFFFIPFHAV